MIRLLSKVGQFAAWAVILAALWVLVASVVFVWIDNEPTDLSSTELAYAWVINAPRFLNEFFATVYLGAAAIAGTAVVAGVAPFGPIGVGIYNARRAAKMVATSTLYGTTRPATRSELADAGIKTRNDL